MSRYIDADKLEERLREKIQSFIKERGVSINAMFDYERGRVNEIENCILMISDASIIDVVEIVRCKDCVFSKVYQNDSSGVMGRFCEAFTQVRMVIDDDYCSYGKEIP